MRSPKSTPSAGPALLVASASGAGTRTLAAKGVPGRSGTAGQVRRPARKQGEDRRRAGEIDAPSRRTRPRRLGGQQKEG